MKIRNVEKLLIEKMYKDFFESSQEERDAWINFKKRSPFYTKEIKRIDFTSTEWIKQKELK